MTGRLDVALVDAGLSRSRSAAREAIQSGRVSVGGRVVTKPAYAVCASDALAIEGESPYVSRAALKLVAALDAEAAAGRPLPVAGAVALDVGASTGGFTEVLLERGADTVIALDVGHGQLDARIALDARVAVVEGVNARELTPRAADAGQRSGRDPADCRGGSQFHLSGPRTARARGDRGG